MRNNLLILASTFALAACQTTGPVTKFSDDKCNAEIYSNIAGPEFIYVGEAKYVTNYFDVAYDISNYKYDNISYNPLIGNKFKFAGKLAPKEFKSQNPYTKVITIDGKNIEFSSNVKSMVVTKSCHAFWFSGHANYDIVTGERAGTFEKSDKSKVSLEDFKFAYGLENVKNYAPEAKIDIDKFAKTATITTTYQDSLMLRAWTDHKLSKKPTYIQIYTKIFLMDWAHFDRAISDDGKARKLVKIDTDVRNCGNIMGCQIYETVGIHVPLSYVEKNKDGFEVQAYGKQKEIIKIPKYQITEILNVINKIK